jgi:hypothetical protein
MSAMRRLADVRTAGSEGLKMTDTVEKLGTWAEVTLRVKH